jgi:hypothetical protein
LITRFDPLTEQLLGTAVMVPSISPLFPVPKVPERSLVMVIVPPPLHAIVPVVQYWAVDPFGQGVLVMLLAEAESPCCICVPMAATCVGVSPLEFCELLPQAEEKTMHPAAKMIAKEKKYFFSIGTSRE